jgi:hypothetical protein
MSALLSATQALKSAQQEVNVRSSICLWFISEVTGISSRMPGEVRQISSVPHLAHYFSTEVLMNVIGPSPHRTLVMGPSVPHRERPPRIIECLSHLPKYFSTTFTYPGTHPWQGKTAVYQTDTLCIRRMPVTPPKHF